MGERKRRRKKEGGMEGEGGKEEVEREVHWERVEVSQHPQTLCVCEEGLVL